MSMPQELEPRHCQQRTAHHVIQRQICPHDSAGTNPGPRANPLTAQACIAAGRAPQNWITLTQGDLQSLSAFGLAHRGQTTHTRCPNCSFPAGTPSSKSSKVSFPLAFGLASLGLLRCYSTALIEPAHHQQRIYSWPGTLLLAAAPMLQWCLPYAVPCVVSTTCFPLPQPAAASCKQRQDPGACSLTPRAHPSHPPHTHDPSHHTRCRRPEPQPHQALRPSQASAHAPLQRFAGTPAWATHHQTPTPAAAVAAGSSQPDPQVSQPAAAEQTATPWLTTGKQTTGRGKTSSLCCQAQRYGPGPLFFAV